MKNVTICSADLVALGFKKHTAILIIRQAKENMIQKGYSFYNNRRLGRVPIAVVEDILGVSFLDNEQGGTQYDTTENEI